MQWEQREVDVVVSFANMYEGRRYCPEQFWFIDYDKSDRPLICNLAPVDMTANARVVLAQARKPIFPIPETVVAELQADAARTGVDALLRPCKPVAVRNGVDDDRLVVQGILPARVERVAVRIGQIPFRDSKIIMYPRRSMAGRRCPQTTFLSGGA